jgi:hypothetical protein
MIVGRKWNMAGLQWPTKKLGAQTACRIFDEPTCNFSARTLKHQTIQTPLLRTLGTFGLATVKCVCV